MTDVTVLPWLPNYGISDDGRVYSYLTNRWLKGVSQSTSGYPQIRLMVNGKAKTLPIHRLVAEAWLGEPSEGTEVNHLNGDKTDNRAANLEWVTRSKNIRHAQDSGLIPTGENRHNAVLTHEDVRRIKDQICCGARNRDIAIQWNMPPGHISNIRTGRIWAQI